MALQLNLFWELEDAVTPKPAAQADGTKLSSGTSDSIVGTAGPDFTTSLSGGSGDDQIWGLAGNDNLSGGTENDRLYGGDGIDGFFAGPGDDWVYGENDSDTLFGEAGNDILYGGAGGDVLNGMDGNDLMYGGSGGDRLNGGAGNDRLVGGLDQPFLGDTLTGGLGDDSFVFRFSVDETPGGDTESFTQWLVDHGHAAAVNGNEVRDGTAQGVFASQYNSWLQHLVETYGLGSDTDLDGLIEVDLNQNDSSADATPHIEGMSAADLQALFGERDAFSLSLGKKKTTERHYSNSFSTGGDPVVTLLQGEGNDIVADFGVDADLLRFEGMTAAQFDALVAAGAMTISYGSFGGSLHPDARLAWSEGSITILGSAAYDVTGLFSKGVVQFDTVL
jgi:hypothetical protein